MKLKEARKQIYIKKKKGKDIFTRYIASQTLGDGEGNSFEEGEERDKNNLRELSESIVRVDVLNLSWYLIVTFIAHVGLDCVFDPLDFYFILFWTS